MTANPQKLNNAMLHEKQVQQALAPRVRETHLNAIMMLVPHTGGFSKISRRPFGASKYPPLPPPSGDRPRK